MTHNINPKIWGRDMWNSMYFIAFSYPDNPTQQDKINYRNYFEALSKVLPCETCRYHYSKLLNTYLLTDLVLESRENLIKWLLNVNNDVNRRVNKPDITYDKIMKRYNNIFHKKKSQSNVVIINIILLIVLIILLLTYMLCSKA